jgi:pimeloyl-ACP methyl ester carboxylesterase
MLAQSFSATMMLHPGFGASSRPYWMDAADDYVLIHLSALQKFHLRDVTQVGAALGGWAAADLGTKNTSPIARIVLVSPTPWFRAARACHGLQPRHMGAEKQFGLPIVAWTRHAGDASKSGLNLDHFAMMWRSLHHAIHEVRSPRNAA